MKEPQDYFDALYKGPTVTVTASSVDEMASAITTLRKARGWTQKRLAQELETKQENVGRWEANAWRRISIWRLADVADALGLSLELKLTLPHNSHPKTPIENPELWSRETIERIREADGLHNLDPETVQWAKNILAGE